MEKEKNTINSAYYLNEKEEKQWAQVSRQGADHDDFNNNIKSWNVWIKYVKFDFFKYQVAYYAVKLL